MSDTIESKAAPAIEDKIKALVRADLEPNMGVKLTDDDVANYLTHLSDDSKAARAQRVIAGEKSDMTSTTVKRTIAQEDGLKNSESEPEFGADGLPEPIEIVAGQTIIDTDLEQPQPVDAITEEEPDAAKIAQETHEDFIKRFARRHLLDEKQKAEFLEYLNALKSTIRLDFQVPSHSVFGDVDPGSPIYSAFKMHPVLKSENNETLLKGHNGDILITPTGIKYQPNFDEKKTQEKGKKIYKGFSDEDADALILAASFNKSMVGPGTYIDVKKASVSQRLKITAAAKRYNETAPADKQITIGGLLGNKPRFDRNESSGPDSDITADNPSAQVIVKAKDKPTTNDTSGEVNPTSVGGASIATPHMSAPIIKSTKDLGVSMLKSSASKLTGMLAAGFRVMADPSLAQKFERETLNPEPLNFDQNQYDFLNRYFADNQHDAKLTALTPKGIFEHFGEEFKDVEYDEEKYTEYHRLLTDAKLLSPESTSEVSSIDLQTGIKEQGAAKFDPVTKVSVTSPLGSPDLATPKFNSAADPNIILPEDLENELLLSIATDKEFHPRGKMAPPVPGQP